MGGANQFRALISRGVRRGMRGENAAKDVSMGGITSQSIWYVNFALGSVFRASLLS
jgi:hypothetical protein